MPKKGRTKNEKMIGWVPAELNAALEELQGLMGKEQFSGFLTDFELSYRDSDSGIARAKVGFAHGQVVILVFEWSYPLCKILVVRFSLFMNREDAIRYMRKLQRMAGPVNWSFQPYLEIFDDGCLKFRLSKKNLKQLNVYADMKSFFGRELPWDDPEGLFSRAKAMAERW